MKLISFSIWGDNQIYLDGMLENIRLAPIIYPGWVVRVYHDNTVPADFVDKMKSLGTQTVLEASRGAWDGLFWRFYPASEDVDIFIVRDADSRLNFREKAAVDEWLESGKGFHSMRDHWNHNVPIMGGMWGCRWGTYPQMKDEIDKWKRYHAKGTDQEFLHDKVWDSVRPHTLAHDRYHAGFFRLANGETLLPDKVKFYSRADNCGDLKDTRFPRGKVVFIDGRTFQRLSVYHYDPQHLFGKHDIKPFPDIQIEIGRYIGESSQDFNKEFDPLKEDYI